MHAMTQLSHECGLFMIDRGYQQAIQVLHTLSCLYLCAVVEVFSAVCISKF